MISVDPGNTPSAGGTAALSITAAGGAITYAGGSVTNSGTGNAFDVTQTGGVGSIDTNVRLPHADGGDGRYSGSRRGSSRPLTNEALAGRLSFGGTARWLSASTLSERRLCIIFSLLAGRTIHCLE